MKKNRKKFTIIELLVVIAIIGILAALLLPTLNSIRLRGQKTTNVNNLKQIYLAMVMYAEENKDYFPYLQASVDNAESSQCLFLCLPQASYNLEIFWPPSLYTEDLGDENNDLRNYVNNKNQLIADITSGATDLMPGYAYSPFGFDGNAIRIGANDISTSEDTPAIYPIASNINGTYQDEAYFLYSDGSVGRLKGSICNDSIVDTE